MEHLKPRFLILANNAYFDDDDKLVIEREIKSVALDEVPGLVPRIHVAYHIDVPRPKEEPVAILDIAISVYNQNNELLPGTTLSWPINLLSKNINETEPWPLRIHASYGGWYVKQTGKYSVSLEVNGTAVLDKPLYIRRA